MLIVYLTVLICLRQGINALVKLISPTFKTISVASILRAKESLENELENLKNEQSQLSMIDDFAKYAKLQRKISPLQEEVSILSSNITQRQLLLQTMVHWIFHAVVSVLLLYQIYMHKYEPVLVVPPELVSPHIVSKIVSFPTGVPGNVGCVFWVFICKFAVGSLSKYFC